jgi:FkbM family methyltransferase
VSQQLKNAVKRIFAGLGYEIRKRRPEPMSLRMILARMHAHKPINIIFDVGANEGQSAIEFRTWFPGARIISFEPHGMTYQRLAEYAASDSRWDTENLALGAKPGETVFHENQVSGANSILATDRVSDRLFQDNPHRTKAVTCVKVDRLDDYCDRNAICGIDFLNIDTQGFDHEVLKGAGSYLDPRLIRVVLTEVLFVPLYQGQAPFHDILETMDRRGYRLFNLIGGYVDETNGLYWSNALFTGAIGNEDWIE